MASVYLEQGKNAYYRYIACKENIEKDIVEYIAERIKANQDTIAELLKITKESLDINNILEILKTESKYKAQKTITMDANGLVNGTLITSKGVLLKEESNVEKVIQIYIDTMLSRNAVVVSDKEYSEISVKKLILEIIQIALEKFGVDKNLIQLLPSEEVKDKEFNTYKETKNKYIYLENKEFEKEVDKKYLIEGEVDEVIEKINEEGICDCAVIYTKDKEKAYKFLNRANSKNVFVNTKLENMKEDIEIDDWYIYKNVIYPTR